MVLGKFGCKLDAGDIPPILEPLIATLPIRSLACLSLYSFLLTI
ncbi:hypothetical protein BCO_0900017 [Borrelia coriaceae ATCC 43381]|uniref:Uncharacterized protein n=1 Tax=Borrelia coriaceae ATCC 43381 TaxID=1408429 RepID=W5SVT9_9SPIR|nr:hypothetical protein BCO_0900017 [Borrelia coriaceae ATCC 43381]